jgi:hypothetical protein
VKREGTVRIIEEMRAELPWHRYTASWQPAPDAPAETFYSEDGPGWNDIEEAVAWGRRHAPVVYVRLGRALNETYNAGEKDDRGRPPTERWSGSRRRRARNVHPDYGGVVYIDEEQLSLMPAGTFRAAWASADDEFLEEADEFDDVEQAVDWGRERATVVLVAELPSSWSYFPAYEIRSAGDEDPPGEPVERLRPRSGEETLTWAFSTQRAASGHDPGEFGQRLEAALRKDDTVGEVRCDVREETPLGWSFAAIIDEDGEQLAAPLPIQGWIDVSFHVSAPTRKRGFEVALGALHRALTAAGETQFGFTGGINLRAVDSGSGRSSCR